jgi:hypothetical protein
LPLLEGSDVRIGRMPGKPPSVAIGERYGRLTVLGLDPNYVSGRRRYVCHCDCGRETIRYSSSLRQGQATSCGCGRIRHGHTPGGLGTPTFKSWDAMKYRCTNPSSKDWPSYGGRGITVCEEWLASFENFLADMGERPPGRTLDRIDPNGSYCKTNCRWATPTEQGANKRNSVPPTIRAEIRALVASGESQLSVARHFGLHPSTVSRICRN